MSDELGRDAEQESARYVRTELLERIAHELRGPAGVTLGALDEIERVLASVEGEDARALLLMARRGIRRILRTAERLTRTAQLEAGPVQLSSAHHDVRDLVSRATREAEQIEARSSVQVELVTPAQACIAQVDATWLGFALGELVSQAIRTARRLVQVHVSAAEGWVRVSVQDDRTTPAAVVERRFVPLKDKRDCALAWPLIQDVARAHGGELQMEPVTVQASGQTSGARATLRLELAGA